MLSNVHMKHCSRNKNKEVNKGQGLASRGSLVGAFRLIRCDMMS